MARRSRLGLVLLAVASMRAALPVLVPTASPGHARQASGGERLGALPLRFEPNLGQFPPEVRFGAHGAGFDVALDGDSAHLSFRGGGGPVLRFRGGAKATLVGVGRLGSLSNYLIGRDPAGWHTRIPNFGAVRLAGLYPGIDVLFHGGAGRLEYDFEVAPGADPEGIRLAFEGAESVRVSGDGALVVSTSQGELRQPPPPIFTRGQAHRERIAGGYRMAGASEVGFAMAAPPRNEGLLIDPTIDYSTFLAGSDRYDSINAVTVDADGSAYVTGCTSSADFPLQDPLFGTFLGSNQSLAGNAFVTKFAASGSSLVFSTYLGGAGSDGGAYGDCGTGIAINAKRQVYVAGDTGSADFPVTPDGFQQTLKGQANAFLTVLSATGEALVYSTLLGGSGLDLPGGLALDSAGRAFIAGHTFSEDFPLLNAIQPQGPTSPDLISVFLSGLDPAQPGEAGLFVSTYLGVPFGFNPGYARSAVQLDDQERIYVAGPGQPPETVIAGQDVGPGFYGVALYRLVDAGTAVDYAVTIGQMANETPGGFEASTLAVDSSGGAYLAGATSDSSFPTTPGALEGEFPRDGGPVGFLAKRSADGAAWEYATYLGGAGDTEISGIAIDPACDAGCIATVVGTTDGPDFPFVNPIAAWGQQTSGNIGFIAQVNATASGLIFSSPFYFYPGGITEDTQGDFFVTGASGGPTMLTVHPFQATSLNGGPVLAKFAPNLAPAPVLTSVEPAAGPASGGTPITLTGAQFESLSTVTLDGMPTSDLQFLSSTELSAVTRPHAPGMVNVTVTNGDGQTVSLIEAYTYEAEAPDAGLDGGSTQARDAGTRADGGSGPLGNSGGCGCSQGPAAEDVAFATTLLLALAARRRGR